MSTNDAGLSDELVVELTPAEPDLQVPAQDDKPAEPADCDN